MLKLFYAPHTCALASHIALEEAGADYETARARFPLPASSASPTIWRSTRRDGFPRW